MTEKECELHICDVGKGDEGALCPLLTIFKDFTTPTISALEPLPENSITEIYQNYPGTKYCKKRDEIIAAVGRYRTFKNQKIEIDGNTPVHANQITKRIPPAKLDL